MRVILPVIPVMRLCVADGRERDGAVDQSADVSFPERGAQQRLHDARADLDLDRFQRAGADFFARAGAGSAIACCAASCAAEKRRSSAPAKCAKRGSVPIRSTDRWVPVGPITFACCSSTGSALSTPGTSRTAPSSRSSKPPGPRASSWNCVLPTSWLLSWETEWVRLVLATWEANSRATPIAIPMIAKHSCTSTALARRRAR